MPVVIDAMPQRHHAVQIVAARGGAQQLLHQHGVGYPAPSGGKQAVFDRHVIIHQHRRHRDAAVVQQLGGGFEVEHVAGVVLDQQQHPGAAVDRLAALVHFIRRRRGENFARTGAVEHPFADETAVHRLMAAAAAGQDRHFAHYRRVSAGHERRIRVHQQLGMGLRQPL